MQEIKDVNNQNGGRPEIKGHVHSRQHELSQEEAGNRRQEIAGEAAFYGISYWISHGQMIEEQVAQEGSELPEVEIMPTDLSWDDVPCAKCCKTYWKESVPIRDMQIIAETLAEHAP